jgi:DNA-binding MarR family transcriptional regulator
VSSARDEAEERAAVAAEAACTCALLRRTTRRLTQAYDQALRPTGLRVTQYSLLATLAGAGGLSITELAALMVMDRTTLTRNLRPLERAGWVRVGAGGDQRSRAVALTAAGRGAFERALPLWQEAERAFRRRMGRDEAALLRRLLGQAGASAGPP